MFSTEGLPGVGVGGWWDPGLLNGQQDSSAIGEGKKEKKKKAGEKEEKKRETKTVGEQEGTKKKSFSSSSLDRSDPKMN